MTESFPRNFSLTKNIVIRPKTDTGTTSKNLALTIAQAALDRKAIGIVLLNVAEISYLSDYFVIMTGYSKVQVRAIADAIEGQVEIEWQRRPQRTEGKAEGTWVLQDYGDVIVHIMMPREREFYNLEAFWGHAERISIPNSDDVGG
ncbi:ribosome silencing factor [Dolichospermum sp. FACHB-1091]|uniref:ribosome silencing factor n=1 Tax=Dolichospermum sp. FACHB-1091 TaxID=2692798 RepID=UPI00168044F4|nr:ribosome silencing factor [Dolichospermum sp. FACHB-1091]MBD2442665.1 ribosome silencing factor [Dolichospermum sp. FACHB-1091]